MNCNTCRFELSQCLDGRLPSGRRALVLQHAATCHECGGFWSELQAAQRLTLQLQQPRVGSGFRESLWQRIQAGEGTPAAVFHEPVPLLTKVRYAVTGAAAAAAVLAGALWLQRGDAVEPPLAGPHPGSHAATVAAARPGTPPASEASPWARQALAEDPLFASTQRLTFDLVAVETAKQLEQRYAAATMALRRLDDGAADDAVVRQVFENTDEFEAFGELLLDLRDRKRLFFTDAEVGADLRVAVDMLGQSRHARRDVQTVRAIVAPALRSSRLASVSRKISLVPALDPREELDVLLHLNTRRPEIFPKLFFVLGHDHELRREFGLLRTGPAFVMEDDCGPSWVAPRSEVEARAGRLRILRGQQQDVEVRIELSTPRR